MKKKILIIIIVLLILAAIAFLLSKTLFKSQNLPGSNPTPNVDKNSVTYNGWLHTDGAQLKNEKNELIQLRGVSSHGIEWFPECVNYKEMETLKKDWNINVFRVAMYTDAGNSGYVHNPDFNMTKVCNVIDDAIKLDMYVIVDWHILSDNNPQIHQEDAAKFFDEISRKYADKPNVIYEICNEPNGNTSWENNVKPYAEKIIPIIRNNSKNSFIIVGTPNWCLSIDSAANSPLKFDNVAYSFHFYAGSHGSEYRKIIDECREKNIPIFISECGLTDASGNGLTYFKEFEDWITYINDKNLSWVYWSFCNKNESSAILTPAYSFSYLHDDSNDSNKNNNSTSDTQEVDTNDSIDFNDYLSEAGKFIREIFKKY